MSHSIGVSRTARAWLCALSAVAAALLVSLSLSPGAASAHPNRRAGHHHHHRAVHGYRRAVCRRGHRNRHCIWISGLGGGDGLTLTVPPVTSTIAWTQWDFLVVNDPNCSPPGSSLCRFGISSYTQPSTDPPSQPLFYYHDGQAVTIICQADGELYKGTRQGDHPTSVWDYLGNGQWLTDFYVNDQADGALAISGYGRFSNGIARC
jgi:hypothetical protein